MSSAYREEHSWRWGDSRNFFTGMWTRKTLGSRSLTLFCLLCALIGGFRSKHPLLDLIMLGKGLEGVHLGSQLPETLDTVVGRVPSPLGLLLLHFVYCRRMRGSGDWLSVYTVYTWGLAAEVTAAYS